jgi:hypothetical protein
MVAPIQRICAAAPAVTALLGANPIRLYAFGEAPQNVAKPYAVWQVVSGSPLNFVSGEPSTDRYGLQVDVYADTGAEAEKVSMAIRRAIGPYCYITGFNLDSRDTTTKNYRKSFDAGWLVDL